MVTHRHTHTQTHAHALESPKTAGTGSVANRHAAGQGGQKDMETMYRGRWEAATPLLTSHPGLSLRSLGARGAGGALQGGLGQAPGEGAERRVCHRGRGEEFVPAGDCSAQVQLVQHDLGHAHEALVVHAAVVSPDDHLPVGGRESS